MGHRDTSEEQRGRGAIRHVKHRIDKTAEANFKQSMSILRNACRPEPEDSRQLSVSPNRATAAGASRAARAALCAIRFYQANLSVWFGGSCRFQPTCSQYGYEAIERFGVRSGSWLGLKRLLRCHPFSGKFGFDPVPEHDHEIEFIATGRDGVRL